MTTIRKVIPLDNYQLDLVFADGTAGVVDVAPLLQRGASCVALQDPILFAKAMPSADGATVSWPNGVDFCANRLYLDLTGHLPADNVVTGILGDPKLKYAGKQYRRVE